MDNVYSGHWSTDCNRAKYITMGNKKGSNYLSLNRKYPVRLNPEMEKDNT